jgi:hypothetical protein
MSFRDCGGNHPRVHSTCCPDTWCRAAPAITLGPTVGWIYNLRLARPLSRNEEIALRPLDQIKWELCPEIFVGPAGQFLMGAKDGEAGSTPFGIHG